MLSDYAETVCTWQGIVNSTTTMKCMRYNIIHLLIYNIIMPKKTSPIKIYCHHVCTSAVTNCIYTTALSSLVDYRFSLVSVQPFLSPVRSRQ